VSDDGQVGYWFEEKARLAFMAAARRLPLKAVRLYDSKSSGGATGGNWLPEQPADMIWMVAGVGTLAEFKASDATRSLAIGYKKKMKPAQIGGARLWLRAGGASLVIFCGRQDGVIELWDGYHVVEAWMNGWRKLKAEPLKVWTFTNESEVGPKVIELLTFLVERVKHESTYLHRSAPGREQDGEHDDDV
jgi:hypothetical protein